MSGWSQCNDTVGNIGQMDLSNSVTIRCNAYCLLLILHGLILDKWRWCFMISIWYCDNSIADVGVA